MYTHRFRTPPSSHTALTQLRTHAALLTSSRRRRAGQHRVHRPDQNDRHPRAPLRCRPAPGPPGRGQPPAPARPLHGAKLNLSITCHLFFNKKKKVPRSDLCWPPAGRVAVPEVGQRRQRGDPRVLEHEAVDGRGLPRRRRPDGCRPAGTAERQAVSLQLQ